MSAMRILIVEDEILVARDIQTRLRKLRYKADWIASSGAEAISLAAESAAQLILMDISLGNGPDGVATAAQIHKTSTIPIVYLTAFSDEASLTRAKGSQTYGYVIKPVETAELRIAIEIALSRYELQSRLNESNRCLATTLASIGDGVISTDSAGGVKIANRAAAEMLRADADKMIGRKIDEIFKVRSGQPFKFSAILSDPVTELLSRRTQRLAYTDVFLQPLQGPETPIDVTATLIRDDLTEPEGVVLVFQDITQRRVAEEYVRYLAYHDNLTGLPNRALFYERVRAAIAQSTRHARNLALLFLDLDDFKAVNDSLGHDAGDALLRQLAARLKNAVRDDDTVARLAGDEFVIILTDIANDGDVEAIATTILTDMDQPFQIGETDIRVTGSIGIALFPTHGTEIEKLLRYADTAMYMAKQKGKNAYAIYEGSWKSALPIGDGEQI